MSAGRMPGGSTGAGREGGAGAIAATLLGLSRGHVRALAGLVGLNLLAYAFEGLGVSLLVPLLFAVASGAGMVPIPIEGSAFLDALFALADRLAGPDRIGPLAALVVACIFVRSVTVYAGKALAAWLGGCIGHELRGRVFARVVGARAGWIDARPPGMLLNALAGETWRVAEGVKSLAAIASNACAVAVFLGLMLLVSPALTAIVCGGLAVLMATVALLTRSARRVGRDTMRRNEEMTGRIAETLGGLATVRAFGREAHERARFDEASARARRAFLRLDLVSALPSPALTFLFAAFVALLIVLSGAERLIELALVLALVQRMQPHAVGLAQARVALLNLAGPLEMLTGMLGPGGADPLPSGRLPAPAPRDAIRLERVTHRYAPGGEPALSDVTCAFRAGSTTALVGPSGAGKSTIAALVCRLLDPAEGEVTLDGVRLRDLDLAGWRERVAVVPQDTHLFNATIGENIAYGRPGATAREIAEAARLAGATGFVAALPRGLDTPVGERGTALSGGQRQRIALARALLRDPAVLVLDEATSALDGFAAALVREAVETLAGERTVIVIAHRLASVLTADRVIVLDGGRVVEEGRPRDLLAASGLFARLAAAEGLAA